MAHIIYFNDNINANDRYTQRMGRLRSGRRRKFRIITKRKARISQPYIRVFVRDRTVRELAREREGVRKEVRDRPMVWMKSTIKINAPIICQLVISYFICLVLTAIFIRYMFVL